MYTKRCPSTMKLLCNLLLLLEQYERVNHPDGKPSSEIFPGVEKPVVSGVWLTGGIGVGLLSHAPGSEFEQYPPERCKTSDLFFLRDRDRPTCSICCSPTIAFWRKRERDADCNWEQPDVLSSV
ncbi:hypothetical protein NPIL_598381 [Nephila pilipes]|uniref:Uncharacterized protein n=1 Tax=Nephila pilipes TaxID=299642 RepID=A0A8X6NG89_NEPPI|nr:hypothetical protein NPIL_598381 [Nephila pilipes]